MIRALAGIEEWPRRQHERMKRREFLVLTAGALLLPNAARAQQTKRRRIAFLAFGSRDSTEDDQAFRSEADHGSGSVGKRGG